MTAQQAALGGAPTAATALDQKQKQTLYRDGFVVLPGAVPASLVRAARRRLFMGFGAGDGPRGDQPVFLDLFNATALRPIVQEALGPVDAARQCQLVTRWPAEPSQRVNEAGYRDRDTPFRGWHGHLDGLWNGATAVHQDVDRAMTAEQLAAWHQEPSRNGCRKAFPEHGANVANFAVLVAVALSDQRQEGSGNVGVLAGAHHAMERFFQTQRAAGGPLGPDGPNWPRVDESAPNGAGLRHYPDAVRRALAPDGETTADGRFWPRPTLLRLAPGDAALVLHLTPHSATRVEGSEPRLMAYFRVTPQLRPAANRRVHPKALCDIWHEWPGMAATVAEARRNAPSAAPSRPGRTRTGARRGLP